MTGVGVKRDPMTAKIEANMRPGVISLSGFLGNDTRSLDQIIADDSALIRRLGYSTEIISQTMERFRDLGKKGLGEYCSISDNFDVKVESVRGKMVSPFSDRVLVRKTNTTVLNRRLKRSVTYTDMHIHMIGMHSFFEGKGSPYRLEPAELVDILEIPPLED